MYSEFYSGSHSEFIQVDCLQGVFLSDFVPLDVQNLKENKG